METFFFNKINYKFTKTLKFIRKYNYNYLINKYFYFKFIVFYFIFFIIIKFNFYIYLLKFINKFELVLESWRG